MTTTVESPPQVPVRPSVAAEPVEERRGSLPIYVVVALIALLWILPALGLLINSFREPSAIRQSGWWTVFGDPEPSNDERTVVTQALRAVRGAVRIDELAEDLLQHRAFMIL